MKNMIWNIIVILLLLSGSKTYASTDGDSLRIMSYNVHNALGMDGKRDYKRIADIISASNPDIVALQELDSMTHRNNNIDALERIARGINMNYIFGSAIDYDGGKYGIGIISKEKPLNVRRVPLPGREEVRVLLIAEYEKYIFLATHLSLTSDDQKTSVEIILKEVASMKKPVFMAGDMNSVPSSKSQTILRKHFDVFTDCDWITCNGECIDYIYGYKMADIKFSVLKKVLVEDFVASDHCPVYIDVQF